MERRWTIWTEDGKLQSCNQPLKIWQDILLSYESDGSDRALVNSSLPWWWVWLAIHRWRQGDSRNICVNRTSKVGYAHVHVYVCILEDVHVSTHSYVHTTHGKGSSILTKWYSKTFGARIVDSIIWYEVWCSFCIPMWLSLRKVHCKWPFCGGWSPGRRIGTSFLAFDFSIFCHVTPFCNEGSWQQTANTFVTQVVIRVRGWNHVSSAMT